MCTRARAHTGEPRRAQERAQESPGKHAKAQESTGKHRRGCRRPDRKRSTACWRVSSDIDWTCGLRQCAIRVRSATKVGLPQSAQAGDANGSGERMDGWTERKYVSRNMDRDARGKV